MRWNPKTIAKIVEARRAQRAAAEATAARANAGLRAAEARRQEGAQALDEHQRHWAASLNASSLNLQMAGAWATAVQDAETSLQRLEGELDEARSEQRRQDQARALAAARAECVEDLALSLRRRIARLRDEVALNEMADRDLQRRRTP